MIKEPHFIAASLLPLLFSVLFLLLTPPQKAQNRRLPPETLPVTSSYILLWKALMKLDDGKR